MTTEVIVTISLVVDVAEVVRIDVIVSFEEVLSCEGEGSLMTCLLMDFPPQFERQPLSKLQKADEFPH
jgi:hypothetical protein